MSWETAFPIGVAILALALAYGLYRYATRNRANDRITEEAARELREDPDAYEAGGRARLQRQIKP